MMRPSVSSSLSSAKWAPRRWGAQASNRSNGNSILASGTNLARAQYRISEDQSLGIPARAASPLGSRVQKRARGVEGCGVGGIAARQWGKALLLGWSIAPPLEASYLSVALPRPPAGSDRAWSGGLPGCFET